MTKCTTDKYDILYARWLENPGSLLDLTKFKPSDTILDLCGGTGAISHEAIRRGAKHVYLLDLNPRCADNRVVTVKADAHDLSAYASLPRIDVCVIRQALGYLDLGIFKTLARVLSSGAKLAFNGFLRPKWGVSFYKYKNIFFMEASGHIFGRVGHIQVNKHGIDLSIFKHHTIVDVRSAFKHDFSMLKAETTNTAFRMLLKRK